MVEPWSCSACTYDNEAGALECGMCGRPIAIAGPGAAGASPMQSGVPVQESFHTSHGEHAFDSRASAHRGMTEADAHGAASHDRSRALTDVGAVDGHDDRNRLHTDVDGHDRSRLHTDVGAAGDHHHRGRRHTEVDDHHHHLRSGGHAAAEASSPGVLGVGPHAHLSSLHHYSNESRGHYEQVPTADTASHSPGHFREEHRTVHDGHDGCPTICKGCICCVILLLLLLVCVAFLVRRGCGAWRGDDGSWHWGWSCRDPASHQYALLPTTTTFGLGTSVFPTPGPAFGHASAWTTTTYASTLPYDCQGGASRTMLWPAPKRSWCCEHEGLGCRTTAAPEVTSTTTLETSTSTTLGSSVPYDCKAGHSNRDKGWSAGKKTWCCKHEGVSCPMPPRYDCSVGRSSGVDTWSPLKQTWCCKHGGHGCSTSTTTEESSLPFDCKAGHSNRRKGWSAEKFAWCCKHEGIDCPTTTTTTTTATSTQTSSAPFDCKAGHANRGKGWSARKKEWCCAHEDIDCTTTTTETTTSTTSAPYDCRAGHSNRAKGWSAGKKRWCCKHEGIDCPTTTTTYDCEAGRSSAVGRWSERKQAWCCDEQGLGCSTTSTSETTTTTTKRPFDCRAAYYNWENEWSLKKKIWCCHHEHRGCTTTTTTTSPPYDCRSGYPDEVPGWSFGKRAWCCRHEQRGCTSTTTTATSTTVHFDCAAQYSARHTMWSNDKTAWCCLHEDRGCPTHLLPYNCDSDFSDWEREWTIGKKSWCCLLVGRGCEHTSEAPTTKMALLTVPPFTTAAPAPERLTTSTRPVPTQSGCDTPCIVRGTSATCRERIQDAANDRFLWKPSACASAHNLVLRECASCFACPLSASGCATPAPPANLQPAAVRATTTTAAAATVATTSLARAVALDCDSACSPAHRQLTCKSLILLAAGHRYSGEPDACSLAYDEVLRDCTLCSKCLLADVGCSTRAQEALGTTTTAPPPYNCQDGYSNWRLAWSADKKRWCCLHERRGCPLLAG